MRTLSDFLTTINRVRVEGNLLKVPEVNNYTFWEDLEAYLTRDAVTAQKDIKTEIIETFEAMLINEIAPRCHQNGFETMNITNIKWYIEQTAQKLKEAHDE